MSKPIREFVMANVSDDIKRHLLKIDSPNVYGDYHRVNVWTQRTNENKIVPSVRISASFLLEVVDDQVVDKTL